MAIIVSSARLNGSALPGFTLRDDYPITYTRETSVPPHLVKPGENLLSLSVHRGDPRVISELWIEDVELMVRYGPRTWSMIKVAPAAPAACAIPRRYPLIAPIVIPRMNHRWNAKNTIMIGMITTISAAE